VSLLSAFDLVWLFCHKVKLTLLTIFELQARGLRLPEVYLLLHTIPTAICASSQVVHRTCTHGAPLSSLKVSANTCLANAARRKPHRGRGRHHLVRKRNEHVAREQTPSTIQQTPDTVSERLRVPATQAGWTAGSDTLTSAEVAMGSNFDPLGKHSL
jgi:hypothetical protein